MRTIFLMEKNTEKEEPPQYSLPQRVGIIYSDAKRKYFPTEAQYLTEKDAYKEAKIIAYEDLGAEAIRELKVENFPVFVANDTKGNDIFMIGVEKYRR